VDPTSHILFEHETIPFDWTDRELHAVARLSGSGSMTIVHLLNRPGQRLLRTTQYVGIIRLGSYTIQVLPKLYQAHGITPPAQQAARNLLYLLTQTADLDVRDSDVATVMQQHSDWFEALIALFTNRLVDLWQRGPQRTYQPIADELPLLKGKWRVADQLRRPDRPHRLAVLYDEFTVDQPLNQLLRCAVEVLWRLARHPSNRRGLETLRDWMEPISLLPPTVAASLTLPPLTRLNRHYAPLLNLARLLLRQAAPQLSHGKLDAFAFVFDMNQLFERF
jgi:5-methylcytosine-specific restriction enzyme subunit McrC